MQEINNYINGSVAKSQSSKTIPVYSPSTGEQVAVLYQSGQADVDKAVAVAADAFATWGQTAVTKRVAIMYKFRELLIANTDRLAQAIAIQHGKVFEDAKGEIARGLEVVEFACGMNSHQQGQYSRQAATGIDVLTSRFPLGVVAGITPFNFPCMVPLWMFPMAIVTGNTFILKPSEKNPAVSLILAELLKEAGLPDGVFNVINGSPDAVNAILEHNDIKAVSFVGSTPIAEYVYQKGCAHNKRVQALGGAKNHMIVMPDADVDGAVDCVIGAGYGAAGERCMAISVVVAVGDTVADKMVAQLQERAKSLDIGQWNVAKDMGAVISKEHREKIIGYIEKGVAEGADLLVDGRNFSVDGAEGGYYLGGSLFDNVTTDMTIWKEEIFGPVLSVVRAKSYQDAMDIVDAHEYANGVALFTNDGDLARNFVNTVEVGMVGVNVPIPVPVGFHSFGGWKRSLFGAHGIYGPESVHFYSKPKTITQRWSSNIERGAEFNFTKR